MFINTYDIKLDNTNGETVGVSLRLSIGAQLKLKKKFNEPTTATLFGAMDDVERFIDVMDASLKWKGNDNTIQSGEELIDLMAANGLLGMVAKQKLIVAIGEASGLFSKDEASVINKRSERVIKENFFDEEAPEEEPEKN